MNRILKPQKPVSWGIILFTASLRRRFCFVQSYFKLFRNLSVLMYCSDNQLKFSHGTLFWSHCNCSVSMCIKWKHTGTCFKCQSLTVIHSVEFWHLFYSTTIMKKIHLCFHKVVLGYIWTTCSKIMLFYLQKQF